MSTCTDWYLCRPDARGYYEPELVPRRLFNDYTERLERRGVPVCWDSIPDGTFWHQGKLFKIEVTVE